MRVPLFPQRGDTARALPLYERALAIWEAACGSDHPDVAHTLTDIAVIHLEQASLQVSLWLQVCLWLCGVVVLPEWLGGLRVLRATWSQLLRLG